jgi:hypothetical protein
LKIECGGGSHYMGLIWLGCACYTGGAPVKNSSTIAFFYQLTNIDKDVCIREQTVLKKYIYKKLGFMQELKLQCQ